jgi:hypothetical protein
MAYDALPRTSSPTGRGIHHLQPLESEAVEAPVPGKKAVGLVEGMGANKEIRDDPAGFLRSSGPEAGPAGGSFQGMGALHLNKRYIAIR